MVRLATPKIEFESEVVKHFGNDFHPDDLAHVLRIGFQLGKAGGIPSALPVDVVVNNSAKSMTPGKKAPATRARAALAFLEKHGVAETRGTRVARLNLNPSTEVGKKILKPFLKH